MSRRNPRRAETAEVPGRLIVGELVAGYDVPVVDERAARASAGILFLIGIVGVMTAALVGEFGPLRAFGMVFIIEMLIRLTIGTRFAPLLRLGGVIVRRQRPEWVGAAQKRFAWALGLGLALPTCLAMGWLGLPAPVVLALCGLCLTLLFLEVAFGICIGCELQLRFGRSRPAHCPGGRCDVAAESDRRTVVRADDHGYG